MTKPAFKFLIIISIIFTVEVAKGAEIPNFPTKPIHIIIPGAAGGSNDRETRTIAPFFEKLLGTRIIIDYVPGADGAIAYNKFYKAKPDGYTLLSISTLSPIILEMSREVDYKTKDYALVGTWNAKSQGVFVNIDTWRNFEEFLSDARRKKLSLATVGGVGLLQFKLLENAFDIKFNYVPYKSGGESLSALAGKHVDVVLTYSASALPLLSAKKIRAIATFAPDHDPFLQGVPNFPDLGYSKVYSLVARGGFFAPPKTPSKIIALLEKALSRAVKDGEFLKIAKNSWVAVEFLNSAEATKTLQKDYDIVSKFRQVLTSY